MQKAPVIASGRCIIVTTFDNTPDSSIAFASSAAFPPSRIPENAVCIQLLIVTVSIILLITDINEPIVIGIDIANIVFISFPVVLSSCSTV